MPPSEPLDDGNELKRKSKRGGSRPGSGRKPGSKNVRRAPVSLKKLDEAGVDPLLELITLFKVANNDAVISRPRVETRMVEGKATEVVVGNKGDYRWAMEYAAKILLGIMPYQYAKLAPIDQLGAPVPANGPTYNVNLNDARQQFVALVNREIARLEGPGSTGSGDRAAVPRTV